MRTIGCIAMGSPLRNETLRVVMALSALRAPIPIQTAEYHTARIAAREALRLLLAATEKTPVSQGPASDPA